MNACDTQQVKQYVDLYLHSGIRFDIGNPNDFDLLVNHVSAQLPAVQTANASDDFRLVVAMCVLGPTYARIPPEAMRDQLLAILRQFVPDQIARQDRLMEFAIAYGCGKWRILQPDVPGVESWNGNWPGAFSGLVRVMEPVDMNVTRAPKDTPAVERAVRWIADHVVFPPLQVPTGLTPAQTSHWEQQRKRELIRDPQRAATEIAHRLIHHFKPTPLPIGQEESLSITCTNSGTEIKVLPFGRDPIDVVPGLNYVFTMQEPVAPVQRERGNVSTLLNPLIVAALDEETRIRSSQVKGEVRLDVMESASVAGPTTLELWECTCGWTNCPEQHRLEGWDPHELTLWAFVSSAVTGPSVSIQTGSFRQGMYFPLLAEHGPAGTRLRLTPVEYKICNSCERKNETDHRHNFKYESGSCPCRECSCDKPFNPETARRVAYERLILVGAAPAVYERFERLRCTNKQAHYEKLCDSTTPLETKLSEKWDNIYNLPPDWEKLSLELAGVDNILIDPMWLSNVADDEEVDVEDVRQRLLLERNNLLQQRRQLIQRVSCPLCNAKPPQRPTIVWVRQ